jgi:hypothetical protein
MDRWRIEGSEGSGLLGIGQVYEVLVVQCASEIIGWIDGSLVTQSTRQED